MSPRRRILASKPDPDLLRAEAAAFFAPLDAGAYPHLPATARATLADALTYLHETEEVIQALTVTTMTERVFALGDMKKVARAEDRADDYSRRLAAYTSCPGEETHASIAEFLGKHHRSIEKLTFLPQLRAQLERWNAGDVRMSPKDREIFRFGVRSMRGLIKQQEYCIEHLCEPEMRALLSGIDEARKEPGLIDRLSEQPVDTAVNILKTFSSAKPASEDTQVLAAQDSLRLTRALVQKLSRLEKILGMEGPTHATSIQ